MIKKIATIGTLFSLLVLPGWHASAFENNDFAQDVSRFSDPSPRDSVTGSSIQQFGAGQTNSQLDNYLHQDEQINLDDESGIVRVLRTNQKANINEFVTEMVPVKNANPRELRGLARTIARKEGGDADVLYDKMAKQNYLIVVAPEYLIPFITKTVAAVDREWISEVGDGAWYYYYQAKHRDIRNIQNILQLYRTPDAYWAFDDPANAISLSDQPCIQGLYTWGTETVDIPPNQLTLDIKVYEVDTQNDLAMGFDWETWKNGPGSELFEFIFWDFGGDNPAALFPTAVPSNVWDWGRYRAYNALLTTAYIDFLQAKGKAKLLTKATLSAKSGSVADLTAVDQIASFASTGGSSDDIPDEVPFRLGDLYKYAYQSGAVDLSPSELLAAPDKKAILQHLLGDQLGLDSDLTSDLLAKLPDDFSENDLKQSILPSEVVLRVFRDRTLRYRRTSENIGMMFSMLPIVGLQSAEVAVALDVSQVNGYTPSGTPIIEHRYLSTDVEIADGQPFVLSGIKRTAEVSSAGGMPFLRDIPWLGYAFGREVTTKRTRELVIIATPTFKLCPTAETHPPEELKEAVEMARGEKEIEVPDNPMGFDQWLLDPAKSSF